MSAGILFAVIALGLPFLTSEVRRNARLKGAVLIVLLAHQTASALQVILNGLPTMKMDPLTFNSFAMTGEGNLARNHYAQLLHGIYNTLGGSHFLGCQISNVWFSLALIVQIQILRRLGYSKSLPQLILIFGLLPSCILNTSVVLREAAQICLYLALALLMMDIGQRGLTPRMLLIFPVAAMLTYLHQGMAALLVFVIPLGIAWAARAKPAVFVVILTVGLSTGVLVKDKVMDSLKERSTTLAQISEGNMEYLEDYATKVNDSRTSFGVSLDLGSASGFFKTGPILFGYYLFSPLPWQIRGGLDLYGFFESLVRMALCLGAFQAIRTSRGERRTLLLLLFLLFITMEAGWAIGTANWGTAFRHRLVAWGLLVAMGGGALFRDKGASESEELESTTDSSTGTKLSIRQRRRALRQRRNPSSTSRQI